MLSGVIIAWNEERDLPRAIHSLQSVCDEVVVVIDKATTDNSAQIAKDLKCRVFEHEHTGFVEPIREFAIAKTKGDWVLLLDADEEITPESANEIKEVLASDTDYCRIPRQNIIFGKWIKSHHWWPDYVVRLFKKDRVKWDNKIHSQPMTLGKKQDLKFPIVHHNYASVSEYLEHLNRYTDKQIPNAKFNWSDLIQKPMEEFLRHYFARKGYQDGLHGLALAGLQAFSEFILYLKLWEREKFVDVAINDQMINAQITKSLRDYYWWSENKFKNKLRKLINL